MSTFKYESKKYVTSQCGVCRTRIVEGDEVCFVAQKKPSQTILGKESFIMAMTHVGCAKQEGYRELDPSQPTWMRPSGHTTRRTIHPEERN